MKIQAPPPNFRLTTDREVFTTETERESNVMARYVASSVAATTAALLIDLSDTTAWPHDATARIDISNISVDIDKASNTVGTIKIGVVTRVDATNGDVAWVFSVPFVNDTATRIFKSRDFPPSQIKTGVSGGALTRIITNDVTTNSTAFQTDVALASTSGVNTAPAVGDIVILFEHVSGGSYNAVVSVLYHGETTP